MVHWETLCIQIVELPDRQSWDDRARLPPTSGQTETKPKKKYIKIKIHKQEATRWNMKVLWGWGRAFIYTTNFPIGWRDKILNSVTFRQAARVLLSDFKLFMLVLDIPFISGTFSAILKFHPFGDDFCYTFICISTKLEIFAWLTSACVAARSVIHGICARITNCMTKNKDQKVSSECFVEHFIAQHKQQAGDVWFLMAFM